MANVIERPKLVVKSLGDPKAVLKMEGESASLFLGTIYGVAQRIKVKASFDKAGDQVTHEQIVGEFEGIPAMPLTIDGKTWDRIHSGVLYLPKGIHDRLAEPLKADGAPPIEFALRFYSIKKTGGGFSWKVEPLFAPVISDPLGRIRAQVLAPANAVVAESPKAPEAPAKAAGKR